MYKVVKASALSGWRIQVTFDDGTAGVISLKEDRFGPMFEPLREPDYFAQLAIDEFGVICWPNGADLPPDALYDDIRRISAAS
jgi:hypothetical protein